MPEIKIFLRFHSNAFSKDLLRTKIFAGLLEWKPILEAFDLIQLNNDVLNICVRHQRRYKRLKTQDSCPHGGTMLNAHDYVSEVR